MKVFTTQPFQLVYSLFEHEYLGYLFESFVIQVNSRGELTLQHQNISAKNADEFAAGLDAKDFKLIALIDQIQQDAVLKKFSTKKLSSADFFLKVYDPEPRPSNPIVDDRRVIRCRQSLRLHPLAVHTIEDDCL